MLEPQKPIEQRSPKAQDLTISQLLRQQFEYYFSFVNLVTDRHMLATMQQTPDGSVSVHELLQFPRIKQLLDQCFEFQLTWPETENLIDISVGGSSKLVIANRMIKPKRRFKWQRDRKRVLYLEGQGLTKHRFLALLQSLQVPASATSTRQGQNWLLAEFPLFTQPQLRHLIERLTQTAPAEMSLKIIRIEDFSKYLQRFNSLFHPPRKFLTQYEIPSKRILQYDEFPIARRLKLGEEEEIRENNLNYEYIFRNLIDTLNPMTPQRYEAFRAQKIKERKQRKQQKKKRAESEMDLQQ